MMLYPKQDQVSKTRGSSYQSESEDESDDDLRINQIIMSNSRKVGFSPSDKSSDSSYSSDSPDAGSSEESKLPFSCQYCEKAFKSNADLTRHVRCHTGERPYSCEHCSKGFSQGAHLQRHLLTHPDKAHTHKCPTCDKAYPLKIQLVGHLAVHSKKDPVTKVKTKFSVRSVASCSPLITSTEITWRRT